MSSRRIPGLTRLAGGIWHIDKRIKRFGRLCESTGTNDRDDAERYLARRLEELRQALLYGTRPRRVFREAATKYLTDYARKRSIDRDARGLKDLDAFIGHMWLDAIHNDTFTAYRQARTGKSTGTLNRNIWAAKRILTLAATLWRDPGSNLTWLAQAPLIQPAKYEKRKAYPLDWTEQRVLFTQLAPHLERMALFAVNTGLRDQELCGLKWAWEQRVPELDTLMVRRSVFVLPAVRTKNGKPRVVVLNDTAQSILEEQRGRHRTHVFVYQGRNKDGATRIARMNNSGWKAARRRAAAQYAKEFERDAPAGFRRVRVHDLRHTFGRRLRAAGVSFEDRQDLLGHTSSRVTTDYSSAEIRNLVEAANRITRSRETPELTVLRVLEK
ncbi:MAG TPA: tyrosine-type recombinase/integrase [Steroidobacteraceae bacterium]|jgi:integrase